ncbi:N-acetyl-gamma-glutamyl-phosphate reductase [Nonlabens xiamenensis]|uniref:N-acetyl-gamma-glutamyl-phosphate reductase n=1 Tax=Nonlabens xiamenensis TaxID=2341043 RepID=UPI000F60C48C|nr:N-acetyl-gamma-glutamyl-phosphate reductase [Nonlabens xiamenensis]
MIKVGIIGGAGYTAGELIRLLLNHPQVELDFVFSTSNAGNPIHHIHQDLLGSMDQDFTDQINAEVEVLFLCLGHGNSKEFLTTHEFSSTTRIIDLSNDFRLERDANPLLKGKSHPSPFVYGLSEWQREKVQKAQYIANPGCFATAIQLALLPLASSGYLTRDVHINAVTGATGAGTSLSPTTHFTWRDNNFSHYKAFQHQHLDEIQESLSAQQSAAIGSLMFLPHRGNFSRGIFATSYTEVEASLEEIKQIYADCYKDAAFVHCAASPLHLKQVVNTNKCFLHLEKHGKYVLITSIIDNLLKGASGQAIQNMNLMLGFPEEQGLQLKANFF